MIITIDNQQRTIFGKALKRLNNPGCPSTVVVEHHNPLVAPALFPDSYKYRSTVPCSGCSLSAESTLKRKFSAIECPIELVSNKIFIMDKAPINKPKIKQKKLALI